MGLLIVVLLSVAAATASWPNLQVSRWDVFGYYLYLPATTVYNDLEGLQFVTPLLDRTDLTNRGNTAHPLGTWDVSRARTNPDRYVIKYTMGQALLWWPFFQTAHFYTRHFSGYPPDGYSPPYQLALYLAGLAYALLGLGLMRRLLLQYFSDRLTATVLLTVYLGTNYLNYSAIKGNYSHNSLFVLHAGTLLLFTLWLRRPRWHYALGLGLTIGLAVLIRPSEAIILLVPLLLGVSSVADLRGRGQLALRHWPHVLGAAAVAAVPGGMQMYYWHRMSGHWFYDSYPGEKFDFLHPHLREGLFSFNNGWLLYTPVMVLALVGVALLWRARRAWFWLLVTYLPLHLWISYSWWCWWYMDSFGSRTMVQTYPVLALPLGAALHAAWRHRLALRMAVAAGTVFCIGLNLFQTWQARQGIFVTEYMTQRYYGAIFGATQVSESALAQYDANEAVPNPDDLLPEQVFYNGFDQDTSGARTTEFTPRPPAYRLDRRHQFTPAYESRLGEANLQPGDWVEARVQAYFPQKTYDLHTMPRLVIAFVRPDGTSLRWRGVRITNKVGYPTTIWGGTPGVWDEVKFASKVPPGAGPNDLVRVHAENTAAPEALFVDDLSVVLLRQPR